MELALMDSSPWDQINHGLKTLVKGKKKEEKENKDLECVHGFLVIIL